MLAFSYAIGICIVAAMLFVAINKLEPDRRLAFALMVVIVVAAGVAIVNHLIR